MATGVLVKQDAPVGGHGQGAQGCRVRGTLPANGESCRLNSGGRVAQGQVRARARARAEGNDCVFALSPSHPPSLASSRLPSAFPRTLPSQANWALPHTRPTTSCRWRSSPSSGPLHEGSILSVRLHACGSLFAKTCILRHVRVHQNDFNTLLGSRLPIPHLCTSPPFPPPPPCMRRRIRPGVVSALHVALTLTRSHAG